MRLLRSYHSPHLAPQGCHLTIGNFDAVHLGHQQLLQQLKAKATAAQLPLVVMTFDPHPEEFFRGAAASARLSGVAARYCALKQCGVDIMLCLAFGQQLAHTSAEDFIRQVLLDKLHVRNLLVGDDFRFGHQRRGDYAMLRDFATRYGFTLDQLASVRQDGQRISSSRIRAALARGDLATAQQLLGRAYCMVGRVLRGQQRGRQWGFPTLNLRVRHNPALRGVFAVQVTGLARHPLAGVAHLGRRPLLGDLTTRLEVHLFDFDQDVYGQRICVEFIHTIRTEKHFASIDALKAQIRHDTEAAQAILGVGG